MANIVEFLIKIRDLGSNQMRQFASNSENAMTRVSSRMNRLGSSADQLNTRIDALTRTRNMSIDSSQINRINRELTELERRRDRITNPGGGGSGGMSFLKTGLLTAGVGIMATLGAKTLQAGMERQMAGTSFEVMAGKSQGDKLHKNLMGFATDTIYGNEVFGEAKTMLGFGVSAKNIMPALRMLGDVAMGDVEHMKSLSLAFAQTASAGKLTGQDLLQYVSAGFNPLQALSEKTGRSMASLRKDVEKGKISFRDVAGAFEYATGPLGRFHDGMKKMGDTPTGKWLAFKGALETLAGTIGTRLLPALGGVATFLNGIIGNESVMYSIAGGIGAMTVAWALYTGWTERAAIWTGALEVAAYWPLALIGIVGYAYGGLNKYNSDYAENSVTMATRVTGVFDVLRRTFEDIVYWTQTAILSIQSVGQHMSNFQNRKNQLSWSDAWQSLTKETDADKKLNRVRIDHVWNRANDMAGLDSNGKPKTPGWMDSKLDFKNTPGGAPGGVADSSKGIAGGGVRNLTINIAKMGIDEITLHAASVTEGAADIRKIFIEMFNQVINSGNAAVNPN